MSRIEEAMEKARKLREHDVDPSFGGVVGRGTLNQVGGPTERVAQAGEDDARHTLLDDHKQALKAIPIQVAGEKIEISNPLILAANYDDQPVAEEYRKLKSIIVLCTKKEGFKNTLMVTSSVSGEGKTLTSLNLALSLAQEHDHTVLLVEADLRKPSICKYLGLEARPGLAECLLGDKELGDVLIKTGWGNLSILPAGKQMDNPVELFSSQKMKDLFYEMKYRYGDRYVIIDTPPVLPFAEARLLGTLADGVIFVVKEGGTTLANISEAMEYLKNADVLGTVYNDVTMSNLTGGYGDYGYDSRYKNRGADLPPGDGSKPGFIARLLKARVRA